MPSVFQLIRTIIRIALIVGATGGLVDATLAMRDRAGKARQVGLISLRALNRSLGQQPPAASAHDRERTRSRRLVVHVNGLDLNRGG